MMRLLSMFAGLAGLCLTTVLPAQEPVPAPAPTEQTIQEPAPQESAPPPIEEPAPAPAPGGETRTRTSSEPPAAAPAVPVRAPVAPPALLPENTWNLDLSDGGRVSIQLRPDAAPNSVERIKALTQQGFFNGLVFHRVIQGFMAQSGDPTGTGTGGSPLPDLNAEINGLPHVRGAVGMARAQDMNSANSQFYIMFVPRLVMDRQYTVFGRVVGGMALVDTIERGEPPLNPTRIIRASLGSDNVPAMSAEQLRAEGERLAAAQRAAAATAAGSQAPAPGTPVVLVPAPGATTPQPQPQPQPAPTTPQ